MILEEQAGCRLLFFLRGSVLCLARLGECHFAILGAKSSEAASAHGSLVPPPGPIRLFSHLGSLPTKKRKKSNSPKVARQAAQKGARHAATSPARPCRALAPLLQKTVNALETSAHLEDNPLWFKDAVIYQLHVRSFCDSNADGIGDFAGLSEKLDYLKDLGITAIWVLPFYPSPLKDDGYDISDYTNINPIYGTMRDFRRFLDLAHERGLRVITELVLNHTSDQHAWFKRARHAPPGSPDRDLYVWSDTPNKYQDARIIFKDYETSNWSWDPVAKAYYWHRFYSNQPDLNFDNPVVQNRLLEILDFWFGIGVDGLRLDAVPYLFEREGTNCENLPETHDFLKKLRKHVEEKHRNKMLLAEANQWPEDALAYFGNSDECHMCFHFPLMPRMFMALEMEDRFPITDILGQTPSIPESCQWAIFLRNHDELTLEMVTDEERDYMYRVYAVDSRARINLGIRRRLSPLLGGNRAKIQLLNALLFSLPGTPVVYYGDEIGMGDNIYLGDRNGVRTPMQWTSDRNAGFSKASQQQLCLPVIADHEFHYEAVNVETQQRNPNSLLWWMKRITALRNDSVALHRGDLKILHPTNRKVLCFIREAQDETILVVANMSRYVQGVEIDLSEYEGRVLRELFGQVELPPITSKPYFLTLGAHQFYWFQLGIGVQQKQLQQRSAESVPELTYRNDPDRLFEKNSWRRLERALRRFFPHAKWFPGQSRRIDDIEIRNVLPLPTEPLKANLVIARLSFLGEQPEFYLIPIVAVSNRDGEKATEILAAKPENVIARTLSLETRETGILCEAVVLSQFQEALIRYLARFQRNLAPEFGVGLTLTSELSDELWRLAIEEHELMPIISPSERYKSTITYGNRMFFKFNHRIEAGSNPEVEATLFLKNHGAGDSIASLLGTLEYNEPGREPVVLGLLETYVPNKRNMWDFTVDSLGKYYESAAAVQGASLDFKAVARELIGPNLAGWERLAERIGQIHTALASDWEDPLFAPEKIGELYQRSLYQALRTRMHRALRRLRDQLGEIPESLRPSAERILGLELKLHEDLRAIARTRLSGLRIRHHGDLNLGQVLFTGKDYVIVNFEGNPSVPVGERRIKKSPLQDISTMLRSLDYAASNAMAAENLRIEDRTRLIPWKKAWTELVTGTFLNAYHSSVAPSGLLPEPPATRDLLLRFLLLDQMFREIDFELRDRRNLVYIPVEAIVDFFR